MCHCDLICVRRVWRYQKGHQNPYIKEQTTQWPKEKVQKVKQRSTKHTHKTKDRVTQTSLIKGYICHASTYALSDLSLCLGVPIFLPIFFFTMDFCLCGAILNLKAFCFGAIPDIMIELIVYIVCECAIKQAVMTVAQWHRNQIIRGLWLLAKQMFKMDSCLRGAIWRRSVQFGHL